MADTPKHAKHAEQPKKRQQEKPKKDVAKAAEPSKASREEISRDAVAKTEPVKRAAQSLDMPKRRMPKRGIGLIVAAVLVIAVVGAGLFIGNGGGAGSSAASEPITTLETNDISAVVEETAENPINFPLLMDANNDVYAWIYVPGTEVNLPILQSSLVDNFYLYHDVYKNDDSVGAPYTQAMNSKQFTDPVTVVYGHTFELGSGLDDEAFSTLHRFEDQAFLDEHPYFYIYTPYRQLTYKIVSAYNYDNSHILNTHDFTNVDEIQAYYDFVIDPSGQTGNVTVAEMDRLTAGQNAIVQLSTCQRPAIDEGRYIVTGVLVGAKELTPSW